MSDEDYDSRLNSFELWPRAMPQKAEDLAIAGFVYLGRGDFVQCHHCRGQLNNWYVGDKPLAEHAKHFPGCGYLRKLKAHGSDGIETVTKGLVKKSAYIAVFGKDKVKEVSRPKEDVVPSDPVSEARLKELIEENEMLKREALCKVCWTVNAQVLYEPCYHYATCVDCAASMRLCPVCRTQIAAFVKTSIIES